jgi:hypothetical protein
MRGIRPFFLPGARAEITPSFIGILRAGWHDMRATGREAP